MPSDTMHPPARFEWSCGERDGLPVAAILNTALAGYDACGEFPWLVEIEIEAAHTDDRGLPTPEEVEQLNAIDERLQKEIAKTGAHFVARQTWNGRRMLDFYVADGKTARRRLEALAEEGAFPRTVKAKVSKDASWAIWMPTLVRMASPASGDAGDPTNAQSVLVRIALRGGEFGSDAEQEAVLELCDALSAAIEEAGAGELDGYEFGDHAAMLFAYGPGADRLWSAIEPALRAAPIARKAQITKRYGEADDATAREKTFRLR